MSEYDEHAGSTPDADASDQDGFTPESAETNPGAQEVGDSHGWEAPSSGVAAVDAVLASVQALDDRPVAEHVAVFEQAHDQLRRALDPGHG